MPFSTFDLGKFLFVWTIGSGVFSIYNKEHEKAREHI